MLTKRRHLGLPQSAIGVWLTSVEGGPPAGQEMKLTLQLRSAMVPAGAHLRMESFERYLDSKSHEQIGRDGMRRKPMKKGSLSDPFFIGPLGEIDILSR
jgi:hypothetical protein